MKTKGKKKRHPAGRKSKKRNSLVDLAWQMVGLVTLMAIFLVLVFGDSVPVGAMANKTGWEIKFADIVATFDSSLLENR